MRFRNIRQGSLSPHINAVRQTLRRKSLNGAIGIALIMGSAGIAAAFHSTQAQAFGLGDITGAVKKVVSKAAETTVGGARSVGRGAELAGKVLKKGAGAGYSIGKGIATTTVKAGMAAGADIVVRPALKGAKMGEKLLFDRRDEKLKKWDRYMDSVHAGLRKAGSAMDGGIKYVEEKVKAGARRATETRGTLTSHNAKSPKSGVRRRAAKSSLRGRTVRGRNVRGGNRSLPKARAGSRKSRKFTRRKFSGRKTMYRPTVRRGKSKFARVRSVAKRARALKRSRRAVINRKLTRSRTFSRKVSPIRRSVRRMSRGGVRYKMRALGRRPMARPARRGKRRN